MKTDQAKGGGGGGGGMILGDGHLMVTVVGQREEKASLSFFGLVWFCSLSHSRHITMSILEFICLLYIINGNI